MSPTVRILHAWLLTLLLLLSSTMAANRACAGCDLTTQTSSESSPQAAPAATAHESCCSAEQPTDDPKSQNEQNHSDACDCPLGCCPAAPLKAMSGPSGVATSHAPDHNWDIPSQRRRTGPTAEGPRRPPRA